MPARLVAIDEGADIPLDRAMIVVGRHPQCDARLDSLRVSRHHCCMTQDQGELVVRDLGSTNGIRINGQRVEFGRLRSGDELSIAHIRYRLEDGHGHEATLADNGSAIAVGSRGPDRGSEPVGRELLSPPLPELGAAAALAGARPSDNPLAAAVRGLLPAGLADRCRIQVIVKMDDEAGANPAGTGGAAAE
jgi:FHA domain